MAKDEYQKFPFIAEKLAVEISNSLVGAEVSIREFRNRKLMNRVLDFVTGKNNEIVAQGLADILVSQKAVTDYLTFINDTEIHTQRCLVKVVQNLENINGDLKSIDKRIDLFEKQISKKLAARYLEVSNHLRAISTRIERNDTLKFVTSKYQLNKLYEGFSDIFKSALYIAYVYNLYVDQDSDLLQTQLSYSHSIVKQKVKDCDVPVSIIALIKREVEATDQDVLPMAIFITEKNTFSLPMLSNMLFIRRYVNLSIDNNVVKDCLTIAESVAEDNFLAGGYIFTPYQCICRLANDLIYGFEK